MFSAVLIVACLVVFAATARWLLRDEEAQELRRFRAMIDQWRGDDGPS